MSESARSASDRQPLDTPAAARKRLLVFAEGLGLAHVTRATLLADELARRGHEVHLATSARYQPWLAERGHEARPVYTPEPEAVYSRLRRLKPMFTRAELEQSVDADLALIHRIAPDLVLGDTRGSLRISTAMSEAPYAAIVNANATPWFAGRITAPAALPLSRMLGRRRVDRYLMPWLDPLLTPAHCYLLNGPFARVQKRRRIRRPDRDFRRMFTSDRLNLVADAAEFNPVSDRIETCRHIGPLTWDADEPHREPTEQLLDQLDGDEANHDKPLVYLTLGSTGSDEMLGRLKSTLANLPYRFIVTAKHATEQSWPDNCHPLAFLSAASLLPRVAAVVCQGGNGTIYQALKHASPVIAIPSFFDQEIQAAQLERTGLGVRLEAEQAPETLGPALEHAVHDPHTQQRIETFRQTLATYDAPRTAVEVIERHLA